MVFGSFDRSMAIFSTSRLKRNGCIKISIYDIWMELGKGPFDHFDEHWLAIILIIFELHSDAKWMLSIFQLKFDNWPIFDGILKEIKKKYSYLYRTIFRSPNEIQFISLVTAMVDIISKVLSKCDRCIALVTSISNRKSSISWIFLWNCRSMELSMNSDSNKNAAKYSILFEDLFFSFRNKQSI